MSSSILVGQAMGSGWPSIEVVRRSRQKFKQFSKFKTRATDETVVVETKRDLACEHQKAMRRNDDPATLYKQIQ